MTGERIALASLMVAGYLSIVLGFLWWSIRRHRKDQAWDRWLRALQADEARKRNPNREGPR